MDDLKMYKNIDAQGAVMIAGWPGMGNVALGAVDYLRRKLGAVKFAEIRVDPAMTMDSVVVEKGFAFIPPGPRNTFYYAKDQNLVIFEGEAQVNGQQGIRMLNRVLDAAAQFKVARIYTGAAFPAPVSYSDAPELYGAVNKRMLSGMLKRFKIRAMESGHISGSNGLMLGFARERNIDAACILATIPQYAIGLPNPKASMAVIEAFGRMSGFRVDLTELEEYAKSMGEKMAVIEDKVKDVLIVDNSGIELSKDEKGLFFTEKKAPPYIIDKIERLFSETRRDRTKASMLKEELDRWDLYKAYEDRFLDIFRQGQ